jgi:hypothetical protein
MMNAQQAMIDAVKEKLHKREQGDSVVGMVAEIERLQRDLTSLGQISEPDTPLRLPYSSMPALKTRCWK